MNRSESRLGRHTLITGDAVSTCYCHAHSQRPLAIVVVGGMIMTLFLDRYLMPVLYSFYGHREPPAEAASMAH